MREKISVSVKTLPHFRGELPRYETEQASGFDVRAQLEKPILMRPGERALVPTGLSFEIPVGYEIQVRPRSGWAIKKGITVINSPGTIDADYRGEVLVGLVNLGTEPMEIANQDRIAQFVLAPLWQADLRVTDQLGDTARGAGGFGSTGFSNNVKS